MKITDLMTDASLHAELGKRLTAARLQRNLTQGELATEAGVSKRTIERVENGTANVTLAAFLRIARVLQLLERLDVLIDEPGPAPMDLLARRGRTRQRAGKRRTADTADTTGPWTWGDTP